mmetsp:Transcript_25145/g.87736  ORF Transcript_25145/g.87736 Transcript_25145/m.87736 type:complete len:236 (-) Transcript_25145:197-904(-)
MRVALAVVALVALAGVAAAQEWPQGLHDIQGPASFVEAEPVIFAHGEKSLALGETTTVLVNVVNDGDEGAIEVKRILGSLNSPLQFSFHIVNITSRPLNTVVPPESEMTFAIDIDAPWKNMDEGTLQMALVLFYEDADLPDDERERYSTVFFNETVTLYNPPSAYSGVQSTATVVGAFAAIALVAVFLRGGSKRSSAGSADAATVRSSFVSDDIAAEFEKAQAKKARRAAKAGKN